MDEETKYRSWTRFIVPTLTVAFLLLVLVAMLWPTPSCKWGSPQDTVAKNHAMQVRQAIETFFTEYRRFPVADSAIEAPSHCFYSDHELMDVLLGSDTATSPDGLNPRQITFFSVRRAKGHPPKSGVVLDAAGGGELFDPWGNHYRILIDLNRNDRLAPPPWSTSHGSGSSESIPQHVIVWSPGPDGDDSTEADNVISW